MYISCDISLRDVHKHSLCTILCLNNMTEVVSNTDVCFETDILVWTFSMEMGLACPAPLASGQDMLVLYLTSGSSLRNWVFKRIQNVHCSGGEPGNAAGTPGRASEYPRLGHRHLWMLWWLWSLWVISAWDFSFVKLKTAVPSQGPYWVHMRVLHFEKYPLYCVFKCKILHFFLKT